MSGGLHHLCPSVWGRHTLLSHPVKMLCVRACVTVCVCVCLCVQVLCEKEKKVNSRPPQIALV